MADNEASELPSSVDIHFQKSNLFRVIHADGCFGGVTPRGHLHMAFYNERNAIPRRSEVAILHGQPGTETIKETKGGFVREVEMDVVMDINAVISLHVWLSQKVNEMRRAAQISDDDWAAIVGDIPK